MKKIILITILLLLSGCMDTWKDAPKSNGSNKLSQEECECRGGEHVKTGTGVVMSGAVAVPIDFYKCIKDDEELYKAFRDETCEKYWELKNEKRYKWSE